MAELSVEIPAAKILDFDIETIAAGYADPNWVPDWITCVAWSWIGSDEVESRICTPEGIFGKPEKRRKMLADLLVEIERADVLTGHNIGRFDLPVVNAEAMRLGLEPIRWKRIQDTMKMPRSKGFKKGQDNVSRLLGVPMQKLAMDWQDWWDAYQEPGWPKVRERCESDVLMHKQMRARQMERGILNPVGGWPHA